jgi:hypothetical protein
MNAQRVKALREMQRLRSYREELEARFIAKMEEIQLREDEEDEEEMLMEVQEPIHGTLGPLHNHGSVKSEISDPLLELGGTITTFPGSIITRMSGGILRNMVQEFSPRHLRMWVVTKGDIFSL